MAQEANVNIKSYLNIIQIKMQNTRTKRDYKALPNKQNHRVLFVEGTKNAVM